MRLHIASDPYLIRACEAKRRYVTEMGARSVGRTRLRQEPDLPRLWPYPCAHCKGWHLTRTPNRDLPITARDLREGVSA